MVLILTQMLSIAVFGFIWQFICEKVTNKAVTAENSLTVISSLVYYFMLPALILEILWLAPLMENSVYIATMAGGGVLGSMLLAILFSHFSTHLPRAAMGALILAASFPNATYMGLPVLEETFGSWSKSIALQYDVFACTPILLSLGIYIASSYGEQEKLSKLLLSMLKVPAIWATILAITLNLNNVPMPEFFTGVFYKMGNTVIPLMLFSLGLSLRPQLISLHDIKPVLAITAIQLILMPFIVWSIGQTLPISEIYLLPVVIEGGMPSMLLGLVLCNRYKLDTGLYASAVMVSSLVSLITLPAILTILS
ncbi:MAG: AEC family transporter [gamma proteobacterium symbiont of Bathyaustriella thionipta]|nr:AEC family transporter [gamma proteobacterium symbiont of Bathyaustriella thionipta]MCU7950028.1 AEC family transporter [gamma proteobacterium symbiont of Bathyaustriella thionipta]MCU7952535.1 AEC family transporter [gamma proteobacterium symbiont of Bathyaustriella thionipta]MCU7957782.1 AEC family transporter [gamma proteobacterium symbiont of Bathyaustriella thionipta]MCU7968297.1 AEC family transporter [gamma proteobacterium symbiont of Bathyaustriella thionipta]